MEVDMTDEEFTITIQKPLYVNKITTLFNIVTALYPAQFENHSASMYFGNKKSKRAAELCLQRATEQFETVQRAHDKNLEAIEHNKKNGELLRQFLKSIKLREKYNVIDKKRTRRNNTKYLEIPSTWYDDISATYVTDDGFIHEERLFMQAKKNCEDYIKEVEKFELEEKKRFEQEKAEKKKNKDLVKLQIKYECDESIEDWHDLLYVLCKKDKYLKLAVAMYRTRCDWSDGFYRVEDALGDFDVKNPQDGEICDCVSSCLSSDSDGRVFRDCEWNYDVLFSLVENKELLQDTRLCLENIS
jgi:virulence-associated protein VapD